MTKFCLIKNNDMKSYTKGAIRGSQVCLQVRFTVDMEHISFDESLVVFITELVLPCMNTCFLSSSL